MHDKPIIIWLLVVCLVILAIVAVGGVTRLTESGLSMVDWKPLMGAVPPLNEEAWQAKFEQYQQFPEFKVLKPTMDLAVFKQIFFWEYLHRLLARLSGLLFLVPYLYFLARRRLPRPLALKLGVAFVLGGLQGLLGWYMVKSGLVDNPYVSHYRLAAHLGLALLLFSYLLWLVFDLTCPGTGKRGPHRLARPALALTALIAVQIIYGAFVAGLDAGYMFNTFPTMLGRWVPPGLFSLQPWPVNLVRNGATVQFVHRLLAWVLVFAAPALWWRARRSETTRRQRLATHVLVGMVLLQFALGVATLLLVVPVTLATLHQVLACVLLGSALYLVHALYRAGG